MSETQQPPQDNGPDYENRLATVRAIKDVVKEVIAPELEAVGVEIGTDTMRAFLEVWRNLPMLPGTGPLYKEPRDIHLVCERGYLEFDGDLVATVGQSWRAVNAMLMKVGGVYNTIPTSIIGPGDGKVEDIYAQLLPKFRDGSVPRIINEVRALSRTNYPDSLVPLTPLLLVHTGMGGLIQESYRQLEKQMPDAPPGEIREAALVHAGRQAQLVCQAIQEGTKQHTKKGGVCRQVSTGSFEALRKLYTRPDRDDFKIECLSTLLPLFLPAYIAGGRTSLNLLWQRPELGNGSLKEVARVLAINGIDVESVRGVITKDSLQEVFLLSADDRPSYQKKANALHAMIRAMQYTRRLVDGIADGSINYIQYMGIGTHLVEQPFETRAQDRIERLAAEEAARLETERAEEARLHDLGWLTVELNLRPDDEFDIEVLVPSRHEGGTAKTGGREPKEQAEAVEELSKIEPHRLVVINRVKAMFPGSKIRFRRLRKSGEQGKKPDEQSAERSEKSKVKLEDIDRYILVITPDGDVFAECLSSGATYLFRHETGQDPDDPYNWERVFGSDKDTAKKWGAVRFEHPHKVNLEADYRGTINEYLSLIATDFLADLRPGEQLPESERLRRISLKKLGRGATQGPTPVL